MMDMTDSKVALRWRAVNDGVMGGLSSGGPEYLNDYLRFSGTINTNGGGFSSLRIRMKTGDLSDASGIAIKLRSDGRKYRLTFRTSERWRGRSVSYQTPIPKSPKGEWAEVMTDFEDMRTSVFGRPVRAAPFDPSDVREMGIILADGQDGPFALDIVSIRCIAEDERAS